MSAFWVSKLLALGVALFCALGLTPLLVWIERKLCAWIQDRVGPNRVGLGILTVAGFKGAEKIRLWGLGQPLADAIKLLSKENIFPDGADKKVFLLAPLFTFLTAFLMYAVIPFGPAFHDAAGKSHNFIIADLGVGLLFLLSVGSLAAYGTAFGGWASNSKFSLLGGVRASAQMISYEIAMILAIITIVMINQEVTLTGIVKAQSGTTPLFDWIPIPNWNVFTLPGLIAACIFMPCMYAENNRLPFDLAECEAELVGGFHTEYSAMKFAMFSMGEYVAMTAMTMLFVSLFLGGYNLPYLDIDSLAKTANGVPMQALYCLLGFAVLFLKSFLFTLLSIQVRWTLPRFRYDQLMKLGWQGLIPASLANLLFAAVWLQFHLTWSAAQ
ncbi:MAG TPA: complex I subunit 1 family protein [Planctomycetota bacterium]|nr:complex I subunit 1 family protein [Planctomycetota bacterium]